MVIKSKLTEKDFINASFVLLYNKLTIKIYTWIISIFLIMALLSAIVVPKAPHADVAIAIAVLLLMPLSTYFTAKKNYASNKRISEMIEYQFDKDNLLMKGESFDSQLSWEKVYKVTQTKNWILIWQSRQMANPISRRDIRKEQIDDLRKVLMEHRVKNNL